MLKKYAVLYDAGASGGGGSDFETKVLAGVDSLTRQHAEFNTRTQRIDVDVDGLKKANTKALEDLAQVQKTCNDHAEAVKTIQRAQLLSTAERRLTGLTGIAKIAADPDMSNYIMGHFRRAIGLEMTPVQKTVVTGIDSGIGAAVTPVEINKAIYDALLSYGQWSSLGQVPIGTRTETVPLVTVRPLAYWIAQGAQITEGAFTGTSVTLTIKEAAAWIPIATALLEDESANFSSYVVTQLAQAVAYRLDWACFAADGTADSTDGTYTGIAVGGTAAGAASTHTAVAKLTLVDFVKCLTTVDAGVLMRSPKWWIHPQVLASMLNVVDGNGRPLFQPALDAPGSGVVGKILGFPVVVTGAMPSTDTVSKVVAVFGDPEGAAVGVRQQFNLAKSTDFQFDYNRTAFRMIVRAGFVIKNATSFAMLTTAAS